MKYSLYLMHVKANAISLLLFPVESFVGRSRPELNLPENTNMFSAKCLSRLTSQLLARLCLVFILGAHPILKGHHYEGEK